MASAQENDWYVFVSCTSRNLDRARQVTQTLNEANIRCWLYKRDILVGSPDWLDAVRTAIRDACLFIVLVAPQTIKSEPVHQELTLAYGFGKEILPVWVEGDGEDHRAMLWTDFRDYQAEDVRGERYENGMANLITRIKQISQNCVRLNVNLDLAIALTTDEDSLINELGELGATLPAQIQDARGGLLESIVDKAPVRQYLELCVVRRFEELYRDNPDKRKVLKAFSLAFMYGYEQNWIAHRLNLSTSQVETAQNDGLNFLREDTLLVSLVRDWLNLKS